MGRGCTQCTFSSAVEYLPCSGVWLCALLLLLGLLLSPSQRLQPRGLRDDAWLQTGARMCSACESPHPRLVSPSAACQCRLSLPASPWSGRGDRACICKTTSKERTSTLLVLAVSSSSRCTARRAALNQSNNQSIHHPPPCSSHPPLHCSKLHLSSICTPDPVRASSRPALFPAGTSQRSVVLAVADHLSPTRDRRHQRNPVCLPRRPRRPPRYQPPCEVEACRVAPEPPAYISKAIWRAPWSLLALKRTQPSIIPSLLVAAPRLTSRL